MYVSKSTTQYGRSQESHYLDLQFISLIVTMGAQSYF